LYNICVPIKKEVNMPSHIGPTVYTYQWGISYRDDGHQWYGDVYRKASCCNTKSTLIRQSQGSNSLYNLRKIIDKSLYLIHVGIYLEPFNSIQFIYFFHDMLNKSEWQIDVWKWNERVCKKSLTWALGS